MFLRILVVVAISYYFSLINSESSSVKFEAAIDNISECNQPDPPFVKKRIFKSTFILRRVKKRTYLTGENKVMAEVPFNNFSIATYKLDSFGELKRFIYKDGLNCRSWLGKIFLITGNMTYSKRNCRLQKGIYGFHDLDINKLFHSVPSWHAIGRFVYRSAIYNNGSTVYCVDMDVSIRETK